MYSSSVGTGFARRSRPSRSKSRLSESLTYM